MVLRMSNSSLLYLNLALGLFVAVANGAALLMVLLGRAERLSSQSGEIAAWSIAGLLLAATAAYALRHTEKIVDTLRIQTYLVATLALGLATWALALVLGFGSASVRVVWAVGYLSLLALYCAVLGTHAFAEPRYLVHRRLLSWVLLPLCIAVDILTYVTLTD